VCKAEPVAVVKILMRPCGSRFACALERYGMLLCGCCEASTGLLVVIEMCIMGCSGEYLVYDDCSQQCFAW
jgi:hypothetical protein